MLAIIQARYGSQRYPGKVLEKIGDKTVLQHTVETAQAIEGIDQVVVATESPSTNALVVDECERIGVECYYDYWIEENDVLQRFIGAMLRKRAMYALRCCADYPFSDNRYAERLLKRWAMHDETGEGRDYYAFYYLEEEKPTVSKYPYGDLKEIVKLEALVDAHCQPCTVSDREHVTPYLYAHPDRYTIWRERIKEFPAFQLNIDVPADIRKVRKWYKANKSPH